MTLGFIMSMIVLHRLYSQLCYSIYFLFRGIELGRNRTACIRVQPLTSFQIIYLVHQIYYPSDPVHIIIGRNSSLETHAGLEPTTQNVLCALAN